MTLDQLLRECRARHLILLINRRGRVSLWSPNVRVPAVIRAAIQEYNRELARLIYRSEIAVCPSPELHRHSWDWQQQRYTCEVCSRLLAEVC